MDGPRLDSFEIRNNEEEMLDGSHGFLDEFGTL